MEAFSRQCCFLKCFDKVRTLNFFFFGALNLTKRWLFFTNLFFADKLVLYPPCMVPQRTFVSLLMVVSIMKSPYFAEKGWPLKLPPKPSLTSSSQAPGFSRWSLLSIICWYVGCRPSFGWPKANTSWSIICSSLRFSNVDSQTELINASRFPTSLILLIIFET